MEKPVVSLASMQTMVGLSCSCLQRSGCFLCPCEEGTEWDKEVLRGEAGLSSAEA